MSPRHLTPTTTLLVAALLLTDCSRDVDSPVVSATDPTTTRAATNTRAPTTAAPATALPATTISEPSITAGAADAEDHSAPHTVSSFQIPEISIEPLELSPEVLDLLDGMLISVHIDAVWDFGDETKVGAAVGVADGEAWLMKGRWCNWHFTPAHDAFDGSVLFDEDALFLCTPGDERQFRPRDGTPLATARIDDRRLVFLAGRDAMYYLDLDTSEDEPIFEIDGDAERAISASFSADRWVLVMSAGNPDEADLSPRRILILDPTGTAVVHEHNPFPGFGPDSGLRAAALTSDGATLVFTLEDEDDESTSLVFWDLAHGFERARHQIIEPFVPDDDPFDWGREYVKSIDISGDRILLNVAAVDSEHHPTRALLVDFDGHVVDLNEQEEMSVSGAFFLEP